MSGPRALDADLVRTIHGFEALLEEALFGVGGAVLVLLFTGIHNAWDAVAYHVLVSRPKAENR